MNDHDAASLLYGMARIARNPELYSLTEKLKAAKELKPEWGRPLDEYIQDVVFPSYNSPILGKSLIQKAIDSVQLNKRGLPRPTCATFLDILRLVRDYMNLPLLNGTKVLSSCIHLLREHVKDTKEPIFCYEYGYLCFQVITLATQVAVLTREDSGGFNTFKLYAKACKKPQDIGTILVVQTVMQINMAENGSKASLSRILQPSTAPQGRRVVLSSVGGMTDLDNMFLIKSLWESRKELSYIGSRAATPGWGVLIRIFSDQLLEDFKNKRIEPVMWGYLETLCHRYGIIAKEQEEVPLVADMCTITGSLCSDNTTRHHVQSMVDSEDAQTVVKSYTSRMIPCPGVERLHISFCGTLVDFVFQQEISTLEAELLLPLLRVGYERVWLELADEHVTRDSQWGNDMAQVYISTMGSTEQLFGAEHIFKAAEIEAFLQPLHDIDLLGYLGQAILLPTNLPPDPTIDQCWAKVIKCVISFAQTLSYSKSSRLSAELFVDDYPNWVYTLNYIRLQILHNPYRDKSLRKNAKGAELAWTNIGKIFGFTELQQTTKNQKSQSIRSRVDCGNPRCMAAIDEVVVLCSGCKRVGYCSGVCQNMWVQ